MFFTIVTYLADIVMGTYFSMFVRNLLLLDYVVLDSRAMLDISSVMEQSITFEAFFVSPSSNVTSTPR